MTGQRLLVTLAVVLMAGCATPRRSPDPGERITLLDVHGPLMVIRGTRFMPASAGMKLQRGDQLATLQQGAAWASLRYRRTGDDAPATSCRLPLPPGSQFLITGRHDCAGARSLPLRKPEIPTVRIPLPGAASNAVNVQAPGFSRSATSVSGGAIKGLQFLHSR